MLNKIKTKTYFYTAYKCKINNFKLDGTMALRALMPPLDTLVLMCLHP